MVDKVSQSKKPKKPFTTIEISDLASKSLVSASYHKPIFYIAFNICTKAKLVTTFQLSKVTSGALVDWLRSKGVRCNVKDKKPVLIEKVNSFLSIEP